MADIVDDAWGVIRSVIIGTFVFALCIGILCSALAFITGQERGRKQLDHDTGWRTVQEGRLCDCTTNGLYRIQIKEN